MKRILCLFVALVAAVIPLTAFADSDEYVTAEIELTDEEREFISENSVITMAALDGIAPLVYEDSNGVIRGIAPNIYEMVSQITGLDFEYIFCADWNTLTEVIFNEKADMVAVSAELYETDFSYLHTSAELISAKTILYLNSSIDPNELFDGVGSITELLSSDGVDSHVLSGGRIESLIAVNDGDEDYAFGNEYSVYFYKMLYNLDNLTIVPISNNARSYHSVFINTDPRLESIINKAIEAISADNLSGAIIEGTIMPERELTFSDIADRYGVQIAVIIAAVIAFLLTSVILLLLAYRRYKRQSMRFNMLFKVANDYIYEYEPKTKTLMLSDELVNVLNCPSKILHMSDFDPSENGVFGRYFDVFRAMTNPSEASGRTYPIKVARDKILTFKVVSSSVTGLRGTQYIMGKLIDVSQETAEKELLLRHAERDGMTGLYNARVCRKRAGDVIAAMTEDDAGCLMLLDIDKFKDINDRYGHRIGDKIITCVSDSLKRCFGGKDDITGRVGGDEFFVFTHGAVTQSDIRERVQGLFNDVHTHDLIETTDSTVSLGCLIFSSTRDFEKLYVKADELLYKAKNGGRNKFIIRQEE